MRSIHALQFPEQRGFIAGKKLNKKVYIHVIDALVSDLPTIIKKLLTFLNSPFIINMTKEKSISISLDTKNRNQITILGYNQKKIGYIVVIPVEKSSVKKDLRSWLSIPSNLKSANETNAPSSEKKVNSAGTLIIRLFLRQDLSRELIFLLKNFILTETQSTPARSR